MSTSLVDSDGVTRFVGEIVGGAARPVQAVYSAAAPVVIADGGFAALPFDTLDSGDELLDRGISTTSPTFLATGTYALTAQAQSDAVTAGGFAGLSITVVSAGVFTTNEHPDFSMPAVLVFQAAAGDPLAVRAYNFDGVAARGFTLLGSVLVRLA